MGADDTFGRLASVVMSVETKRRASELEGYDDRNHRSALRHRGTLLATGGASDILAHIEAAQPAASADTQAAMLYPAFER